MKQSHQQILLNSKGIILDSCNTLFDASTLVNKSALDYFPLVTSIFAPLTQLPFSKKIHLEKIAAIFCDLDGFFDFTFYKQKEETKNSFSIIWLIKDKTKQYSKLIQPQQDRQEEMIRKEYEEIRFSKKNRLANRSSKNVD